MNADYLIVYLILIDVSHPRRRRTAHLEMHDRREVKPRNDVCSSCVEDPPLQRSSGTLRLGGIHFDNLGANVHCSACFKIYEIFALQHRPNLIFCRMLHYFANIVELSGFLQMLLNIRKYLTLFAEIFAQFYRIFCGKFHIITGGQ